MVCDQDPMFFFHFDIYGGMLSLSKVTCSGSGFTFFGRVYSIQQHQSYKAFHSATKSFQEFIDNVFHYDRKTEYLLSSNLSRFVYHRVYILGFLRNFKMAHTIP